MVLNEVDRRGKKWKELPKKTKQIRMEAGRQKDVSYTRFTVLVSPVLVCQNFGQQRGGTEGVPNGFPHGNRLRMVCEFDVSLIDVPTNLGERNASTNKKLKEAMWAIINVLQPTHICTLT